MEEIKGYSVPLETMPYVLRGFGEIVEMAQNAPYEPDNNVFIAINAILQYVATDADIQIQEMEQQYLNLFKNNKGGKTA